ncbi:MAG: Mu-like prophage major head subunit gpT family protein [Gemmataceae bacterium]
MKDFNAWLTEKGFDPAALSDDQKQALQAAWRAEQNPPKPGATTPPSGEPSSFDETVAAIEAEGARQRTIQEMATKAMSENIVNATLVDNIKKLASAAVADKKTTAQQFQLTLLQTVRTPGPLVYGTSQPELTESVLEAAVCRAAGIKTTDKDFDDRTLSAVDKRFRGGIGLLQLIEVGARQNGWNGHSAKSDLREAMHYAFARPRRDGFGGSPMNLGPSTLSVSGILSNTANKSIKEAWMYVEDTAYNRITAKRSVSDFKTVTSYSMTGDNQYVKLAPGGKMEHGTLGNETYTNRADTYARILGIDRRDLINDDLGAFAQVGRRLGRGGKLKLLDVFWTEFLANASTFWTAGRGNYDDGTDTAFDAAGAGLKAAMVIWRAKTDPDGKPLGATARILLVPPGHEVTAMQLMSSVNVIGGSSAIGEKNVWAGRLEVVTSDYIANSAYAGYSALAWYILADPNDIPTIETCFLNGNEMPTVETVELDSDRLGIAMRGYHDFGCAKQEYRGSLKLKGEA